MNGTNNRKITAFIGSPRKRGNTDILVDELLKGASAAYKNQEKVYLNDMNIGPCIHCNLCKKTDVCFQKDDFDLLMKKVAESDVVIMGTPIYFWGVTAQMKVFIDRWYSVHRQGIFKDKKFISVIPFEDADINTAIPIKGMLKATFNHIKANYIHELIVPGVNNKGEVNEKEDALASAFKIGSEIDLN